MLSYNGADICFTTGGEFHYTSKAALDGSDVDLLKVAFIRIPVGNIFWDGTISADDPEILEQWHPPVRTNIVDHGVVLDIITGGLHGFWIERKKSVAITGGSSRLDALIICMVKDGRKVNLVVKEREVYLTADPRLIHGEVTSG